MKLVINYIKENAVIIEDVWRGVDVDELLNHIGVRYCLTCGQHKQSLATGEYPCLECGVPQCHDTKS